MMRQSHGTLFLILLALAPCLEVACGAHTYITIHETHDGGESLSGVIDSDGTLVVPLGKRKILGRLYHGEYLIVSDERDSRGILDFDDNWIVEPHFEEIEIYESPDSIKLGGPFYLSVAHSSDTAQNPSEIRSLETGLRMHKVDLLGCDEPKAPLFPVKPANPGDTYGYMNTQWEMEIPPQFVTASYFYEGLAAVQLTPQGYTDAFCPGEGVSMVEYDKDRPRDEDGRILPGDSYYVCSDRPHWPELGGSVYWQEFASGYIDMQGNLVSQFDYTEVRDLSNGRGLVRRGDRFGYVDETGREVIPVQYTDATRFSNGLAIIRGEQRLDPEGGGYLDTMFIDTQGQVVLSDLSNAEPFSEGLAWVSRVEPKDGAQEGYINTKGEWVIKELGNGPFVGGFAWAYDESRKGVGLIDKMGNWVTPYRFPAYTPTPYFDGLSVFDIPGNFSIHRTYDYGWVNAEGKIIWPPNWNDPCYDTEGLVLWPEGSCPE